MKRAYLCLLPLAALFAGAAQTDHVIYEQSIKSTKKSIDREMIEVLYHDAIDAYHDRRLDESLELLDKIYGLDPQYEDVAKLRTSIRRSLTEQESAVTQDSVRDLMRKGEAASAAAQNVAAINYWKQALAINPAYAPAQKKIQEVNTAMGRKEFEAGYIHYRHGELDDALDAWSNAIMLDPTYKQRGLLLLMSKVQSKVERDHKNRLSAQAFEQYQMGNLAAALQSYQELSRLEPRNEEARRYSAKIKIQLSQAALGSARQALAKQDYREAIAQADICLQYGYETTSAQTVKSEAERQIKIASMPKPKPKPKPAVIVESTTTAVAAAPAEAAPAPCSLDDAMVHYRKGLAGMRTKDYHLAMAELDIAAQLCSANEHIYIARQRAQQESSAATAAAAPATPDGGAHP